MRIDRASMLCALWLSTFACGGGRPSFQGADQWPDDDEGEKLDADVSAAGASAALDADSAEDAGLDATTSQPDAETDLEPDADPQRDASPAADAGVLDAACGDAESAACSAPSSGLDGIWQGQTSQDGRTFSFEIVQGGLARIEFEWALPACGSSVVSTFAVPAPVRDGALMRMVRAGAGGISYELTLAFGEDATASGTLAFTLHPIPGVQSCSGSATVTLTASRRPL